MEEKSQLAHGRQPTSSLDENRARTRPIVNERSPANQLDEQIIQYFSSLSSDGQRESTRLNCVAAQLNIQTEGELASIKARSAVRQPDPRLADRAKSGIPFTPLCSP